MAEQSGPRRCRRSANRSWTLCIRWGKTATTEGVKRQSNPHSTSPSLMSHFEKRGTRPCLHWLRTARVFIQSIPPLGKYERCRAATCSRLLTSCTDPFMTSLLCFFCIPFFCYSFCNLVRDCTHNVQSSSTDRSSQTSLCSGFCVVSPHPHAFLPTCCYPDIKHEHQQHVATSCDTQRQERRVWFNSYFFSALDDDMVFSEMRWKCFSSHLSLFHWVCFCATYFNAEYCTDRNRKNDYVILFKQSVVWHFAGLCWRIEEMFSIFKAIFTCNKKNACNENSSMQLVERKLFETIRGLECRCSFTSVFNTSVLQICHLFFFMF